MQSGRRPFVVDQELTVASEAFCTYISRLSAREEQW